MARASWSYDQIPGEHATPLRLELRLRARGNFRGKALRGRSETMRRIEGSEEQRGDLRRNLVLVLSYLAALIVIARAYAQ